MNLDPNAPAERLLLYNALLATMGIPAQLLPATTENVGKKFFDRGEHALQAYRARIQAIAEVVARFAAEDAR